MDLDFFVTLHTIVGTSSFPVSLLVVALYAPKYGFQRKSALLYGSVIMTMVFLFTYAFYYVLGWFGINPGLNSYRTYLLLPYFAYTASEKWKIPALHGADFMIPALFIVRAMVLITCNLLGCALAVPCDWGIYSPSLGHHVFPMDLIDLIANTFLAVFSFYYAKKLNYQGDGRIFAVCMSLLGVVRFLLQFGSLEVWGVRGFNDETVYSLASFAIAIYIFHRYKKKQMEDKL